MEVILNERGKESIFLIKVIHFHVKNLLKMDVSGGVP